MARTMERRTFLLVCALAVAVRLMILALTYGSNDVGFKATWADLVSRVGIPNAYAYTRMLNHPPESLLLMRWMWKLSTATNIAFGDVFRAFQVLADCAAALALYFVGTKLGGTTTAQKLCLFVLLSPAAIFLSAFHGNTDPTMAALLTIAIAFFFSGQAVASGIALAAATGIKIIPLLLVPIFARFFEGRKRVLFVGAYAVAAAVIFLPAVAIAGPVVMRNIFGYAGNLPYEWGVPGVAFAISRNFPGARGWGEAVMRWYMSAGRSIEYAGIAAVVLLVFRSRRSDPAAVPHGAGIMILTVLALAPGFGVQYLTWIVALLPLMYTWRGALWLNAAISLFLFVTYTVWSGGLPWFFADIARPGSYRWVSAVAGYAMWIVICAALAIAIRRFTRMPLPETAG